jgi:hypothetical protein
VIIPYGTNDWRPESNAPRVEIDPAVKDPLRLNDGPYEFTDLPEKAGSGSAAERMAILRDHTTGFCDAFAKRPKQFVALYFKFIDAVIAADRAEIAARVKPFGGLFTADDYAFSALRPLPRAHLPVADDQRLRVDFAFWTGERLVALDVIGDDARGAAWDARRAKLDAAGIQRIEIPAAEIARDDPAVVRVALPPEFAAFWHSERMPSSPFKGAALGNITAGEPEF